MFLLGINIVNGAIILVVLKKNFDELCAVATPHKPGLRNPKRRLPTLESSKIFFNNLNILISGLDVE